MTADGPSGRRRLVSAADVVDVFAYIVVLNLAAQYFPAVIAETFVLSLLTAILLKVVLEVVVMAKDQLKAWFKAATRPAGKVAAGLLLWGLLVASKFVVLELIALLFADRVKLGGFFVVTALILVLMATRSGVRWLLAEPDATLSG